LSDLFAAAIFGNSVCAVAAGFCAQWVTELSGEFTVWKTVGSDPVSGGKTTSSISTSQNGYLEPVPVGGTGVAAGMKLVTNNVSVIQPPPAYDHWIPGTNFIVYAGKFLGPFDLAAVVLLCCGLYIQLHWRENFGYGATVEGQDSSAGVEDHQKDPSMEGRLEGEAHDDHDMVMDMEQYISKIGKLQLATTALEADEGVPDVVLTTANAPGGTSFSTGNFAGPYDDQQGSTPVSERKPNVILSPSETVLTALGIPSSPLDASAQTRKDSQGRG
ncbi:unnamed protein product, partial [Amoebophrya sp. A25]